MNNFFLLTKVFFLNNFSINKKKKNFKSVFATFGGFGILILGLSVFYCFMLFTSAAELGTKYEDIIILFLGAASMLTLVMSLTEMEKSIFNTKDYEFLESLPLKKTDIVGAKITSIFLINFLADFLLVIPSCVFYLIYTNDNYFFVIGLIGCLFVSLIPLLVSTILGALVASITKKLKNKTIFSIITYVLYFGLIFFFSFSFNTSSGIDSSTFVKIMPQLKLVLNAYDPSKVYYILFYLGINIICAILVILFISFLYRTLNIMHSVAGDSSSYVKSKETDLSVQKTLDKKELKMLLGSPQWLVNSFIGPVMFLAMGLMMMLMDYSDPNMSAEELVELKQVMGSITVGFGILMNLVTTTTVASFSLEHKNFEMLLAYPLETKQIIKAKIKAPLLIYFVLNIIAGIVLSVVYSILNGFNLLICLEFIVLPHLSYYFITLVGALCGMRWPKLDYDNEMQVIKQGTAVPMCMLFCFLPGFIISGIVIAANVIYIVSPELEFIGIIGFVISAGLLLIGIAIARSILKNKGEKLFKQISTR